MEGKKIKCYKKDKALDIEKIIEEYSAYVYKIVTNISLNKLSNEDIEEIISDTFFILWKNKDKLYEDRLISSYIAGITKNLIKEKFRKVKINSNIEDYENNILDFRQIDMIYEQREKISVIEKILKSMKKEDIDIFNMYYYLGMKIKDISNKLNVSEFKIKSKLYRIRKKIRKEFKEGGYSNE